MHVITYLRREWKLALRTRVIQLMRFTRQKQIYKEEHPPFGGQAGAGREPDSIRDFYVRLVGLENAQHHSRDRQGDADRYLHAILIFNLGDKSL